MTEPALTAEEWRNVLPLADVEDRGQLIIGGLGEGREDFRRIAALALYGQPFGFTRDDVTAIRFAREALERFGAAVGEPLSGEIAGQYESLADRIEALLPPE